MELSILLLFINTQQHDRLAQHISINVENKQMQIYAKHFTAKLDVVVLVRLDGD